MWNFVGNCQILLCPGSFPLWTRGQQPRAVQGLGAAAPHTSAPTLRCPYTAHRGFSALVLSQDCLLSLGLCTDAYSLALGNKFLLHS